MSQDFLLKKDKFIPATDVGKHLGYTKEYIIMLIKQDKVDGKKIGNKWYSTIESADKFVAATNKRKKIRKENLRMERREELKTNQHLRFVSDELELEKNILDTNEISSYRSGGGENFKRSTSHAKVAFLQTLLIVFLGVSIGSLGYLGNSGTSFVSANHLNFFEQTALAIYTIVPGSGYQTIDNQQRLATVEEVVSNPQLEMGAAALSTQVTASTAHISMTVSADEIFTTTRVSTIEDSIKLSFSDDVEVVLDADNDDSVIVTPKFIDGEGRSQQFKLFPVETHDEPNKING